MYAVIADDTVIDCAVSNGYEIKSAINPNIYYESLDNMIEMTMENSPATIGMKLIDNKFSWE